jgi:hypothetical protein
VPDPADGLRPDACELWRVADLALGDAGQDDANLVRTRTEGRAQELTTTIRVVDIHRECAWSEHASARARRLAAVAFARLSATAVESDGRRLPAVASDGMLLPRG